MRLRVAYIIQIRAIVMLVILPMLKMESVEKYHMQPIQHRHGLASHRGT